MVTIRRDRGYTLIELVVAMSIFSIFLGILFVLTAEMRGWDKRLPVNMYKHPQVMSVLARLRRDVLDAHGAHPYLAEYDGFKMSDKVLILETVLPTGIQKVVWDFTEPGVARRISYNVGAKAQWTARGLPQDFSHDLDIDAVETGAAGYAVRITAKDSNGQIAIDQVLQPRAHE